jgi:hypothetical protein
MRNLKQNTIKWVKAKFTLKSLFSIFITVILGLFLRYLLKEYLTVDVLKDISNAISIIYYTFMVIFSKYSREILVEWLVDIIKPNLMMPIEGSSGGPSRGYSEGNNTNIPTSSTGEDSNAPTSTGNYWNFPTRKPNHPVVPVPPTDENDSYIPARNPYAPVAENGLTTDNRELPSDERNTDWNRPDPRGIPYGPRGKDFTARYGRGEPMDIAIPNAADKKLILEVITSTKEYMIRDNVPGFDNPSMAALLEVVSERGNKNRIHTHDEGALAFSMYKQIRKIVYNEPQFSKWIRQDTDRVNWGAISTDERKKFMKYLRKD